MKAIILIIITTIIYSFSYGQEISLSTITTAGGFVTNDAGISVSWSIGQVFNLTTQSEQHLTEGFQQGKLETDGTIVLKAERKDAMTVFLEFNKKNTINSTEFQLQCRFTAAQDFITIATISNTESSVLEYVDANNSEKNTEYRVLFTNNKTNKISNLANVEGTPRTNSMTIFPNPTVEQLNIKLLNPTDEAIVVNIWDVNGQNVFSNTYQSVDTELINIHTLNPLSKGNYIVEVSSERGIIGSQMFMKM